MEILKKIDKLAATPLVWAIRGYQATLSPDHGLFKAKYPHGFCRFYPSCSEYAKINWQTSGISTTPKIIMRIIRCNPFTAARIDLPNKI